MKKLLLGLLIASGVMSSVAEEKSKSHTWILLQENKSILDAAVTEVNWSAKSKLMMQCAEGIRELSSTENSDCTMGEELHAEVQELKNALQIMNEQMIEYNKQKKEAAKQYNPVLEGLHASCNPKLPSVDELKKWPWSYNTIKGSSDIASASSALGVLISKLRASDDFRRNTELKGKRGAEYLDSWLEARKCEAVAFMNHPHADALRAYVSIKGRDVDFHIEDLQHALCNAQVDVFIAKIKSMERKADDLLEELSQGALVDLGDMKEESITSQRGLTTRLGCFDFVKINGHRFERAERIDVTNTSDKEAVLYTAQRQAQCINEVIVPAGDTVSIYYEYSRWLNDKDNVKYAALSKETLASVLNITESTTSKAAQA